MRLPPHRVAAAAALAILALCAPASAAGGRVLHSGSHGSDVAALQRSLAALGYHVSADGVYGRLTARAVRRYERAHHMTADGRVSPREARIIARSAALMGSRPAAQPPVAPPPPMADAAGCVFPVAGAHSFGGASARFGAPRGDHVHQGQDILAAEGTPLVAACAGTVAWRAYQASAAGNYVVVRGDSGFDYVYMHLRDTALVAVGQRVAAGSPIGFVGHTGDADGPHLHFEMWTAHWADGGAPFDPLPYLQSWPGA